jgi:hypothetical protein
MSFDFITGCLAGSDSTVLQGVSLQCSTVVNHRGGIFKLL